MRSSNKTTILRHKLWNIIGGKDWSLLLYSSARIPKPARIHEVSPHLPSDSLSRNSQSLALFLRFSLILSKVSLFPSHFPEIASSVLAFFLSTNVFAFARSLSFWRHSLILSFSRNLERFYSPLIPNRYCASDDSVKLKSNVEKRFEIFEKRQIITVNRLFFGEIYRDHAIFFWKGTSLFDREIFYDIEKAILTW